MISETIHWGSQFARIATRLPGNEIVTIIKPSGRQILLNKKKGTFPEVNRLISAVLFQPSDLNLLAGSPSIRRQYLDRLIGQISYEYLYALAKLRHLLKQRNELLKNHAQTSYYLAIEEQLAQFMAEIVSFRLLYVEILNKYLKSSHMEIDYAVNPKSMRELLLESLRELRAVIGRDVENQSLGGDLRQAHAMRESMRELLRELLREKLQSLRSKEETIGFTLIGPQRDDFTLFENALDHPDGRKDICTYGSRGEQRLAVVTLKSVECRLLTVTHDDPPLLLLDDVFSELDSKNQNIILSLVQTQQTIITTADDSFPARFTADFPHNSSGINNDSIIKEEITQIYL